MARGSSGRRSSALSPSFYLRRKSVRRGVLGDDRVWRAVFFVIYGGRMVRKLLHPGPEVVSLERLRPGQAVTIAALAPRAMRSRSRRERRRR